MAFKKHAIALFTVLVFTNTALFAQTILVLGDSLSTGYKLNSGVTWVNLTQSALKAQGLESTFVNASMNGETTSGAAARSGALFKQHKPNLVIIELGTNDALKRYSADETLKHLTTIINAAKSEGARVLLLSFEALRDRDSGYAQRFEAVFAKTAANTQIDPPVNFLEKLQKQTKYYSDSIHPNDAAQPLLSETVLPSVVRLLGK